MKIQRSTVQNLLVQSEDNLDNHVSITDWCNGEGFEAEIVNNNNVQLISMSYEDFKVLRKLVKELYN